VVSGERWGSDDEDEDAGKALSILEELSQILSNWSFMVLASFRVSSTAFVELGPA